MSSEERAEALRKIVESDAPKKLIIAGPGTGKSFTFRAVLETKTPPNLAITFINALAQDLDGKLGDIADARTFHGFCKRLLHTIATPGITTGVDYYPPFSLLAVDDLTRTVDQTIDEDDVSHDFHYLDNASGVLDWVIRSGDYYDAVSHLDAVYRVLQQLENNPDDVPTYSQVVVDEYQDFSLMEVRFIDALARSNPILIVGDDDQALYAFKHASASHIRNLAGNASYERFELPFCSRCTEVLVSATHTVVEAAKKKGLLGERLEKRYECYLPDKQADSERYSKITHAHCSVERNNAPYMAKYIHQRLLELPEEDIAQSRADGCPTVLVIGPRQFITRVHGYLSGYFDDIRLKTSDPLEVGPLDGYRRLAKDTTSRLGWRIQMYLDPTGDEDALLRNALEQGAELHDLLPAKYRKKHLAIAELIRRLTEADDLSVEEIRTLETAVGMPFRDIRDELRIKDQEEAEEESPRDDAPEEEISDQPSITVTTLVGAKGLQASHVFVVGLNEGHFPRSNRKPKEDEVCELIVALTRATKSCTLLSCQRFGVTTPRRSVFLGWLEPHLEPIRVDRDYFRSLSA